MVYVQAKDNTNYPLPTFSAGPIAVQETNGQTKYLAAASQYNDAVLANGMYYAHRTTAPAVPRLIGRGGQSLGVINALAPRLRIYWTTYWDTDFGDGHINIYYVATWNIAGTTAKQNVGFPESIQIRVYIPDTDDMSNIHFAKGQTSVNTDIKFHVLGQPDYLYFDFLYSDGGIWHKANSRLVFSYNDTTYDDIVVDHLSFPARLF